MNILLIKNKIQYYESIWRKSIIIKRYDILNNSFPFPVPSNKKLPKKYNNFMYKLKKIENLLIKKKKFTKIKVKNCLLSNTKNISNKNFNLFNVNWDNALLYYMKKFNITPSNQFYNFIKNIRILKNKIVLDKNYNFPYFKLKGKIYKKYESKYIIIKKNQLRILDALFNDGSNKLYNHKNTLKYSEHSGLIDINKNKKIEKIIINAKNNYIDKNDDEIFLPENMDNEADYEFIFHTHPKTDNRIKDQIIYEFPSLGDLLNFQDNYNSGKTQGSIIIAPEGLYIITIIDNNYKIKIPKKEYKNLENNLLNVNFEAYNKYIKNYNNKLFYKKIIKDKTFINNFNDIIKKYNLSVKYFHRIFYKKKYILPDIYLKFNIIETIKN